MTTATITTPTGTTCDICGDTTFVPARGDIHMRCNAYGHLQHRPGQKLQKTPMQEAYWTARALEVAA